MIDANQRTDKIPVNRRTRQEDIFKTLKWENKGINIDGVFLNHMRFVDVIVLISSNTDVFKTMLEEQHQHLSI